MPAPLELVLPTPDAWDRSKRAIRDSERQRNTRGLTGQEPPGAGSGPVVKIVGPRVAITTTTGSTSPPTPPPTTSSTSSTTTTSALCYGNSTTNTATTTTSQIKYLYPAKFAYRNFDSQTGLTWYWLGEDVWAQETNNGPLGIDCYYPGSVCGQYMGQGVVCVRGNESNESCTETSTTTTCACQGFCYWQLARGTTTTTTSGTGTTGTSSSTTGTTTSTLSPYRWVLVTDGCNNPSTTSTSSTTTVDPPLPPDDPDPFRPFYPLGPLQPQMTGACNCLPPDFCPPAGEEDCAFTYTYCSHNAPSPPPAVLCTSTSSTSSTSSTTADPDACGTGCTYKFVGDRWIRLSEDCPEDTVILPDGSICGPCFVPASGGETCEIRNVPCGIFSPPPGCGGRCKWEWPAVSGMWWIAVETNTYRCSTGLPAPCICEAPSTPGGTCGQIQYTQCFSPTPPGGSSSTGTGTSTTAVPGSCTGYCTLRWETSSEEWVVISDCGSSCDCEDPLFIGEDDCDIIRVPCIASTTTTTTTTTIVCDENPCTWECTQALERGIPSPTRVYYWQLMEYCPFGCFCPEPPEECAAHNLGTQYEFLCGNETSTTSSTTTTTIEDPCPGTFGCVARCTQINPGNFGWVQCSNFCQPLGAVCCPFFDTGQFVPCCLEGFCPPCNSFHEGELCQRNCSCPESTTNTATTETMPPGGSKEMDFSTEQNSLYIGAGLI